MQRPISESIKDGKRHEVLEGRSANKSSGEIFENGQITKLSSVQCPHLSNIGFPGPITFTVFIEF